MNNDFEIVDCIYNKDDRLAVVLKNNKRFKFQSLHRFLVENHTGKKIPKGFDVHHKDFNKDNNEIENLEVVEHEQHMRYHRCVDTIRMIPLSNKFYYGPYEGYKKVEVVPDNNGIMVVKLKMKGKVKTNYDQITIPLSRYTMEMHIGRRLKKDERVFHKDFNKHNNELNNLILMSEDERNKIMRCVGIIRKIDYSKVLTNDSE